jgi:tetratricopeptide (TPR) repeat protein
LQYSPRRQGVTPAVYGLIDRAMRRSDFAQAIRLAEAALDAGQRHPVLFNLRAQSKKSAGRLEEALADLEQARAFDAKSAVLASEIAECLNGLGRYEEALAAAEEALAHDRKLGVAWYQKAMAHAAMIEFDAARKAFRECLRRDPDLADAHAQLASLEVEQGNYDAARRHGEEALRRNPKHPIALVASVSTALAGRRLAEAETILQTLLVDRALSPPLRAVAAIQLGDLRDLQGRPDKAFDAYRESRRTWSSFFGPVVARSAGETGYERALRVASFVERRPARHQERPRHDAHHG